MSSDYFEAFSLYTAYKTVKEMGIFAPTAQTMGDL